MNCPICDRPTHAHPSYCPCGWRSTISKKETFCESHKPFPKQDEPPRDRNLGKRTLANLRGLLRMKAPDDGGSKPKDPEAAAEREAIIAESQGGT